MPIAGDDRLRCRACEFFLSVSKKVDPRNYGIPVNKHGAVVRKCMNDNCSQFWLGYIEEKREGGLKTILKRIDKPM